MVDTPSLDGSVCRTHWECLDCHVATEEPEADIIEGARPYKDPFTESFVGEG